jgi:hypothetical protein
VTPPPEPAQDAAATGGHAAGALLRELDGITFIVIDFVIRADGCLRRSARLVCEL